MTHPYASAAYAASLAHSGAPFAVPEWRGHVLSRPTPCGTRRDAMGPYPITVLPPDADADTPIWLLATSPTANKGFDGYVGGIARVFQTPPVGVVTKISFNPAQSFAQLQFGEPVPNDNVAVHFARQEEAREMLTVEPDVSSFVKEKPAARGKVAARR